MKLKNRLNSPYYPYYKKIYILDFNITKIRTYAKTRRRANQRNTVRLESAAAFAFINSLTDIENHQISCRQVW